MKNINKIKRLIKKNCMNYFSECGDDNHYCCNIDGVCIYFGNVDNLRCHYFEQGVLPIEAVLEKEYYLELNIKSYNEKIEKPKPRIKCKGCGKNIEANSNRQRYCERCKKNIKREQARTSMKKSRDKRANVNR